VLARLAAGEGVNEVGDLILLVGAAYAIVLVVVGRLVPDQAPAVLVCAAHAVALVAALPAAGRSADWIPWKWLGVMSAAGLVGLVVGATARVDRALIDIAILGAFGALLLGLRDLARGLGTGEMPARVIPVVIGVALLTTFCWTGPFIEALADPTPGVQAAIRVNPLACVAGGVHAVDWARARPVTYDLFVGQYYPFSYPSPFAALLGWVLSGGAVAGLGGLLARRAIHSKLPNRPRID
jgi:hypothetical protein